MPYADATAQKEAQRRWYERKRDRIAAGEPAEPPKPIPVPARLPNRPHPMVAATRDAAKWARVQDGLIAVSDKVPGAFQSRASKAQLGRALRILQAICVEAERRGYEVGAGRDGQGFIGIGEQRIFVCVTERWKQVPNPDYKPPPQGQWWGGSGSKHLLVPSGELRVQLPGATFTTSAWKDSKRKPVEKKLPLVFRGIEAVAARWQEQAERRRQWEADRRAVEQERERERQERELQEQRAKVVRERAENLRVARDVRDLIVAFEGRELDEDTAEWLVWARKYVEAIDPLAHQQPFPQFDGFASS